MSELFLVNIFLTNTDIAETKIFFFLFGMALFWEKAIEFFTKFIIHFLTYRVESLFNSEFYCLAKSN